MAAAATENRALIEFLPRPNFRGMACQFGMTLVTRKPFSATSELDGNDIALVMVMSAARFRIDVDADDLGAANRARHDTARSRGQIRTSSDPMSQQAIITTKPVLNEPVR